MAMGMCFPHYLHLPRSTNSHKVPISHSAFSDSGAAGMGAEAIKDDVEAVEQAIECLRRDVQMELTDKVSYLLMGTPCSTDLNTPIVGGFVRIGDRITDLEDAVCAQFSNISKPVCKYQSSFFR